MKDWEVVKICINPIEAEMIRGILEGENIPVKLIDKQANTLYPALGIGGIKIFVPHRKMQRAHQIIQNFFQSDGQE